MTQNRAALASQKTNGERKKQLRRSTTVSMRMRRLKPQNSRRRVKRKRGTCLLFLHSTRMLLNLR